MVGVKMGEYRVCMANNKKAHFDYEIIDTYECGIELIGCEVKSIKQKGVSIKEAYVKIINGEVIILGMHVTPYSFNTQVKLSPDRNRRLLMHRREINKLSERVKLDGATLVPLEVYNLNGKIKVKIALAKGKNKRDKREDMKKKEARRQMRSDR